MNVIESLDMLRALRRRWPVVVATTLIAALIAVGATMSRGTVRASKIHEAKTILIAPEDQTEKNSQFSRPGVNLSAAAVMTTSGDVPKRAAQKLGGTEGASSLAKKVKAIPNKFAGSISITVQASKPRRAREIADAFAQSLVTVLREREQTRYNQSLAGAVFEMQSLRLSIASMDRKLASAGQSTTAELLRAERDAQVRRYSVAYERYQVLALSGSPQPPLEVLNDAVLVKASSGSLIPAGRRAAVALATVLGLLLGIGLAVTLDRLDRRVRTREDAETSFGLPVVAEIPLSGRLQRKRLAVKEDPRSKVAAAYRLMRTSVSALGATAGNGHKPSAKPHEKGARPPKVILVTSSVAGEGKTTVGANVAAAFAESGLTVVAVSADLRRPALHRILNVPDRPGLVDAINNGGLSTSHIHQTEIPGLYAVPSGEAVNNPGGELSGPEAVDALAQAREMADVVVIDSSSLLGASDAAGLLPYVDAVLVVARSGRTMRDIAARTGEFVRRVNVPVAGVVLVGGSAVDSDPDARRPRGKPGKVPAAGREVSVP